MGAIFGKVADVIIEEDKQWLLDAAKLLKYRGPDASEYHISENAVLGENAINIYKQDRIPVNSPSKDGVIVGIDGQVYVEQGRWNEKAYLGTLHDKNGTDFLREVEGDFSIFLYDTRSQRLILARDTFGSRPLYYTIRGSSITFASELKALRPSDRDLALDAMLSFVLLGLNIFDNTYFDGIREVPPGSLLLFEKGNYHIYKYKCRSPNNISIARSEGDMARVLLDRINMAIDRRYDPDLDCGSFLSGGVDSSTMVALLSKRTKGKLKTFSIGFGERDFCELADARKTSKLFDTEHYEYVVNATDVPGILNQLIYHCEMPFSDNSIIPTYYGAQLAKQHCRIVFTGDGPDQFWAGSDFYADMRKRRTMFGPAILIAKIIESATKKKLVLPKRKDKPGALNKILRNLEIENMSYGSKLLHRKSLYKLETFVNLFSPDFLDGVLRAGVLENLLSVINGIDGRDELQKTLNFDIAMFLSKNLLVKVDRMTSANSLATIHPYLDNTLFQYTQAIPTALKLNGYWNPVKKYIMKLAVKDILPTSILNAQKRGFETPLERWFRKELKAYAMDILTTQRAMDRFYINKNKYSEILGSYFSGTNETNWNISTNGIFALLTLELWQNAFRD